MYIKANVADQDVEINAVDEDVRWAIPRARCVYRLVIIAEDLQEQGLTTESIDDVDTYIFAKNHDEAFALWLEMNEKGTDHEARFEKALIGSSLICIDENIAISYVDCILQLSDDAVVLHDKTVSLTDFTA